MYSNIGEKIKTLSKVCFLIGTIAAIMVALIIMSEGDEYILIGLIILLAGPLLFWISSFALYGFGEIIVKVTEIAENTRKDNSPTTISNDSNETKDAFKRYSEGQYRS